MSTHKHADDFDALVAQSLRAQVAGKTPPRRVWRRIRAAIAAASPRLPRWRWSMGAQVVLAILVLLGSRMAFKTDYRRFSPPATTFTPEVVVTHTETRTEAIVINPERQQFRALKSVQPVEAHTVATPPINLPPTDVVRPATEVALNDTPPVVVSVVGLKPPMATGGVLR